ncbi:Glucosamine-6-phosphate deaminase 1 [Botrimarina colliarenosi]|uniref:Glucosamine-6-phosphate deaminase 1 n=1 Tax=Botrimarina colliarenosi TaxID=2528001 RepID=A0A5C5ZXS5_9BACT|nr:glucosamine-6-phosphate deaminase [Botrimarina colliarenosi]TWT92454.1 Glucosamine-6-phosphate deaminase 1 [Botrimarina colliarenosi]
MELSIFEDKRQAGTAAAVEGARLIREALASKGHAAIVVATGASQFDMLDRLVAEPEIDWSCVTVFHLDEYVGLPVTHPASFRLYLWQRFISRLPLPPAAYHFLDGQAAPKSECARVASLIQQHRIDVAFVGIGENSHLAFNDPPADFDTEAPFLEVELDEGCRLQQLNEGWFPSLAQVPRQALTMSIRQIMKSDAVICTVPDARKARAVRAAFEGEVSPDAPASILQKHPHVQVYLDRSAGSLLSPATTVIRRRDSSSEAHEPHSPQPNPQLKPRSAGSTSMTSN